MGTEHTNDNNNKNIIIVKMKTVLIIKVCKRKINK